MHSPSVRLGGWATHKQPRHSWQRRIADTPAPPPPPPHGTVASPCHLRSTARARRLSHHHPKPPLSDSVWVGQCTSSPGTAGSTASAGDPHPAAADPGSIRPPTACVVYRTCAQTASTPPCTPPQRCWVVGHCISSSGIAGSIATAGSPAGAAAADPTAPSGPLPPARRTAHARRLPQHHPALPLSEAGWVGHSQAAQA